MTTTSTVHTATEPTPAVMAAVRRHIAGARIRCALADHERRVRSGLGYPLAVNGDELRARYEHPGDTT